MSTTPAATRPPSDRRIMKASDAEGMIDSAIKAHRDYHDLIKLQQEHIDGKTPYDHKKLQEKNLSWMHNRNYGKATAKSEKITADKLFAVVGGYSLGYPVFEAYDSNESTHEGNEWLRDENLRDHYSNAIRMAYAAALESEPRAYDVFSRICYYSTNWGIGYLTRDHEDWLGTGQKLTDVYFPRAQEFDQIDTFIIFDEKNVSWFYEKYKEVSAQDAEGPWNLKALEDVLVWALGPDKKEESRAGLTWDKIRTSVEDYDIRLTSSTRQVRIGKVWNEELENGVTETYVFYDGGVRGEGQRITSEIPFQTFYPGKKIQDFIDYFRDNPVTSTGVVQNMRGIARFSVPDSHHYNVKRNAIEDKVMISGNMQYKQTSRNQGEKFNLHVTSVATLHPVGYEPIEKVQDPRIGEHLAAVQLDEQTYQRETAHFDPSLQGKLGDRATTEEVKSASMEVNRLSNAKDLVLRADWAKYHAKTLQCLGGDAYPKGTRGHKGQKIFFRELARYASITIDEAKNIMKFVEDFEVASIFGDLAGMERSVAMVDDPYKKNELKRKMLYMMGHPRASIEFLAPRMSRFEIKTGEHQLHDLQNSMFWNQQIPIYNHENDPKVALDVHFKRFDEAIQSASQGADPVRVMNYLRTGLEFVKLHIAKMVEDPFYGEQVAKPYISKYQGYGRIMSQLESVALRKADEIESGNVSPETQQQMEQDAIEFRNKEQRKQINQETEGQRREQRHEQNMRQSQEMHAANMQRMAQSQSLS